MDEESEAEFTDDDDADYKDSEFDEHPDGDSGGLVA